MRYEQDGRAQRLYRDRRGGKLMGVCAGLADYAGCNVTAIRALAIIALIWFGGLALIAYLALGFMLPTERDALCDRNTEEAYWRAARRTADEVYCDARHHVRALDMTRRHGEGYATSSQHHLAQQFRDLED
ncbi:PspC domain-containing protein [Frateuria hangzhouensis]|uniref:PspC domain-containing protein n=1 Tax=Frateuria hangzhouensis TaxID=2995589 RepID=UPI002260901B|nr:PspC domain-containing protein [Frateuria sp. STR12]MCX7514661.1 PspC domain-containing protein [Frateuria sp. STR12]